MPIPTERVPFNRKLSISAENQGSDPEGEKPLEKPPENPLEISYTGKSPKIGSLDMS